MKQAACLAGGRVAAGIATAIAQRYVQSPATPLAFLPSEHVLAAEYGVARSTIRRSLAMLKQQGIVKPEHGRGCRILKKEADATFRVAVLQSTKWDRGWAHPELVEAIQRQCLKRKWQVLSIDTDDPNPETMLRTFREARVSAVALILESREIMQCLRKAGIHCIAVETADRGLPIDQVYQDNYGAALQAARYLVEKGHRRIGWVGPVKDDLIAIERFAGAQSTLIQHQLAFRPEDIVVGTSAGNPALELLSRTDRPTAVLAMWHWATMDVLKTATRLGIGSGDLDIVGWGTEKHGVEIAEQARLAKIGHAAMVWSVEEMAEVVASRMQLHRLEPGLRPQHIAIPSRLVVNEKVVAD